MPNPQNTNLIGITSEFEMGGIMTINDVSYDGVPGKSRTREPGENKNCKSNYPAWCDTDLTVLEGSTMY